MKLKKFKKIITVIFLSVTLFALGCGGQTPPTPTTTTTTKPPTSTVVSTSSTTAITSSTTSSKTTTASTTASSSTKVMKWTKPPEMQIDQNKNYVATMETSLGSFKIQLFAKESPLTVNNFVFLSRQGYYEGIIFHRIIKTFMIQTGDPTGTGTGSPGYKFADELPPKHSYDPGIVAMANSGANTNGSQFFICTGADAPAALNSSPKYTQFGKIIEGMDIVQKIASVPVVSNGREVSKPNNPPVIKSITISES
jgi:cyclophilin family peptidyl-prolyl cis-trans isomerase